MKNKGFTLLEITVVIGIIILLSAIFLANYRVGEKQFALKRSAHKLAQDLRRAQEKAMSSMEFEGSFPQGGYGIYFKKGESSYILFADCNYDDEYDESGVCPNLVGEKVEELFLEKGVKITGLSPSLENKLAITFFPPDPEITIKPSASSAAITLSFDEKSINITVNNVGLIDIN